MIYGNIIPLDPSSDLRDKGVDILQSLVDEYPSETKYKSELARLLLQKNLSSQEFLRDTRRAIKLLEDLIDQDADALSTRTLLCVAQLNFAAALSRLSRLDEARDMLQTVRESAETLVAQNPEVVTYQEYLSSAYAATANVFRQLDRPDDAIRFMRESVVTRKELLRRVPSSAKVRTRWAVSSDQLANDLFAAGDFDGATEQWESIAEVLSEVPESERTAGEGALLTHALYRTDRLSDAMQAFKKNVALTGEDHPKLRLGPLRTNWWYVAMMLHRMGDETLSRSYYHQLVAAMKGAPQQIIELNEGYRSELADLLGIDDPSPGSLQAFSYTVDEPRFDPGSGPRIAIAAASVSRHSVNEHYIPIAKLLKSDGYRVGRYLETVTNDTLARLDILIIAIARADAEQETSDQPDQSLAFGEVEIRSVVEWVNDGGRLLLLADNAPAAARQEIWQQHWVLSCRTVSSSSTRHCSQ